MTAAVKITLKMMDGRSVYWRLKIRDWAFAFFAFQMCVGCKYDG